MKATTDSIQLFENREGVEFRKAGVPVARFSYATLMVNFDPELSEDDRDYIMFNCDTLPGEVITRHKPEVVAGPPRPFTHEVTLRAAGNPDFGQYADIGPRKTVRVCGIEEARQIVEEYQATYEMGGGNCAKEHGVVWELPTGPKGRRKRVGRVFYNGRYETVEETAEFERKLKEKYGKDV